MESALGLIMAVASPCTRRAATGEAGARGHAARDRGNHEQQQADGQKAAPSDAVTDAPRLDQEAGVGESVSGDHPFDGTAARVQVRLNLRDATLTMKKSVTMMNVPAMRTGSAAHRLFAYERIQRAGAGTPVVSIALTASPGRTPHGPAPALPAWTGTPSCWGARRSAPRFGAEGACCGVTSGRRTPPQASCAPQLTPRSAALR